MTTIELFRTLHACGVTLMPYPDGTLRYKAPKGVLTSALLAGIRDHKEALLDLVEAFEERAAIAEYCAGLPRVEAEALAWHDMLGKDNTVQGVTHEALYQPRDSRRPGRP